MQTGIVSCGCCVNNYHARRAQIRWSDGVREDDRFWALVFGDLGSLAMLTVSDTILGAAEICGKDRRVKLSNRIGSALRSKLGKSQTTPVTDDGESTWRTLRLRTESSRIRRHQSLQRSETLRRQLAVYMDRLPYCSCDVRLVVGWPSKDHNIWLDLKYKASLTHTCLGEHCHLLIYPAQHPMPWTQYLRDTHFRRLLLSSSTLDSSLLCNYRSY